MHLSKIGLLALGLSSQIPEAEAAWGWGFCPPPADPVGNFQAARYAGRWYEIRYDREVFYNQNKFCITANYEYVDEWPYPVKVNNQKWDKKNDVVTNSYVLGIEGWTRSNAYFDSEGNGSVWPIFYPAGQYNVLDTDYDTYAVIYGCDNWFFFYTHQAWLLARTPTVSDDIVTKAETTLHTKLNGFYDTTAYWLVSYQQSDCKYD